MKNTFFHGSKLLQKWVWDILSLPINEHNQSTCTERVDWTRHSRRWQHRSGCSPCWSWTDPAPCCLSALNWQCPKLWCSGEQTGSPSQPQTLPGECQTSGRAPAWVKDSTLPKEKSRERNNRLSCCVFCSSSSSSSKLTNLPLFPLWKKVKLCFFLYHIQ